MLTMEDLGELDYNWNKHTAMQKKLTERALQVVTEHGPASTDFVAARIGVMPDVASAILRSLERRQKIFERMNTPTTRSHTFEVIDDFHDKVGFPAARELLRVAALWGSGFDHDPPARTVAAIREAAHNLIDGAIGDDNDKATLENLFSFWIEHDGPLPTVRFPEKGYRDGEQWSFELRAASTPGWVARRSND